MSGYDVAITVLQIITPLIVGLLVNSFKNLTTAIKELKVLIETIQRDFNTMTTDIVVLKNELTNIKKSIKDIEEELVKQDNEVRHHQDLLLQLKNAHNNSNCSNIKIS